MHQISMKSPPAFPFRPRSCILNTSRCSKYRRGDISHHVLYVVLFYSFISIFSFALFIVTGTLEGRIPPAAVACMLLPSRERKGIGCCGTGISGGGFIRLMPALWRMSDRSLEWISAAGVLPYMERREKAGAGDRGDGAELRVGERIGREAGTRKRLVAFEAGNSLKTMTGTLQEMEVERG